MASVDTPQRAAGQGGLVQDGPEDSAAAAAVNGVAKAGGDSSAIHEQEQEMDLISQKVSASQDTMLLPIKEDLSEWITRITGVEITPDTFMDVLDSGVVLCSISKLVEKHAKEHAQQGKITEPLPDFKLKCNNRAASGTWFARDNAANFLGWCRAYGMTDETMFDSEDLVSHRQEKPVVNCVLELARIAYKYGIEPPNLISIEREIEKEVKEDSPPPPFTPKPVEILTEKPVQELKGKPDVPSLDQEVRSLAMKCKCHDYVKRISEGVYDIFGKRVFIRLLRGKHLMVRVGGGWDTLENYLLHHDPVQVLEFRHSDRPDRRKDISAEGYLVIKSKYKSS